MRRQSDLKGEQLRQVQQVLERHALGGMRVEGGGQQPALKLGRAGLQPGLPGYIVVALLPIHEDAPVAQRKGHPLARGAHGAEVADESGHRLLQGGGAHRAAKAQGLSDDMRRLPEEGIGQQGHPVMERDAIILGRR